MALIPIKRDFKTRKEALAYRRTMLKTYHLLGYGTQITVRKRVDAKTGEVICYEAVGTRAGSAD